MELEEDIMEDGEKLLRILRISNEIDTKFPDQRMPSEKKECFTDKNGNKDYLKGCLKYRECELREKKLKEKRKAHCWEVITSRCVVAEKDKEFKKKQFGDLKKNHNPYATYPDCGCFVEKCPYKSKDDKENSCRDFINCSNYGCVTPEDGKELERKVRECFDANNPLMEEEIKRLEDEACPYYYRFYTVGGRIEEPKINSLRYLQCYVTRKEYRDFHKEMGIYAVGLSYFDELLANTHQLQLSNENENLVVFPFFGKEKDKFDYNQDALFISSAFQVYRQQQRIEHYEDNIANIRIDRPFPEFYYILRDRRLTKFEEKYHIIFNSEGEISVFLFAWRLLKTFEHTKNADEDIRNWLNGNIKCGVEFDSEETNIFEDTEGRFNFYQRLCQKGYKERLVDRGFHIINENEIFYRERDIREELVNLGFATTTNEEVEGLGCSTEKFHRMIEWLYWLVQDKKGAKEVPIYYKGINQCLKVKRTEAEFLSKDWLDYEENPKGKIEHLYNKYGEGNINISCDDIAHLFDILLSRYVRKDEGNAYDYKGDYHFKKSIFDLKMRSRCALIVFYLWRAKQTSSCTNIIFPICPRENHSPKELERGFWLVGIEFPRKDKSGKDVSADAVESIVLIVKEVMGKIAVPLNTKLYYYKFFQEFIREKELEIIIRIVSHHARTVLTELKILYEWGSKEADEVWKYLYEYNEKMLEVHNYNLNNAIKDTKSRDGGESLESLMTKAMRRVWHHILYSHIYKYVELRKLLGNEMVNCLKQSLHGDVGGNEIIEALKEIAIETHLPISNRGNGNLEIPEHTRLYFIIDCVITEMILNAYRNLLTYNGKRFSIDIDVRNNYTTFELKNGMPKEKIPLYYKDNYLSEDKPLVEQYREKEDCNGIKNLVLFADKLGGRYALEYQADSQEFVSSFKIRNIWGMKDDEI